MNRERRRHKRIAAARQREEGTLSGAFIDYVNGVINDHRNEGTGGTAGVSVSQ